MPNLPEPSTMTIIFDSHVIKVTSTGIADYEWTTSGQSVDVGGYGGTTYYATVTLEDGYEIANVTSTDSNYNLLTFSGNVISFRTEYAGMGTGFTITTKAAAPKQTIDVSTLSGWANLATGNHQITIKTKASGYADSAASNAVTVSKAASVSAGKLYFSFATLHDDTGGTGTVTVNDVEVSSGHQLSFGDVIKILPENNGDTISYTINGQSVMGLTDGSFVVNWTEGGDITYSEVGFGPGGATATTVNYLNPTT